MTRSDATAFAQALAPILVRLRGKDGLHGKDGLPGRDGRDGAMGLNGKDGANGQDGKPGSNGKDGRDGLGFDDFELILDETKGWLLRLRQGERVKEFPLHMPFYRGNWERGATYPKGAGVRWDGAFWWALKATSAQPGEGVNDWQLVVSRGLRGKEGRQGPEGKPGRDLTQLGPDGKKW